jgi:hypothetical protein
MTPVPTSTTDPEVTRRLQYVAAAQRELTQVQDAHDETRPEHAHQDFVSEGQMNSSVTVSVDSTVSTEGKWPEAAWKRVEAEKKRRAIAEERILQAQEVVAEARKQHQEDISAHVETENEFDREADSKNRVHPDAIAQAQLPTATIRQGEVSSKLQAGEDKRKMFEDQENKNAVEQAPHPGEERAERFAVAEASREDDNAGLREARRLQWAEPEHRSVEQHSLVDAVETEEREDMTAEE